VRNLPVAVIVITLALGAGLGCRRSPEARAAEATTLVRAMHADLLDAQKKVIAKFKALPEADAIRIAIGDKSFNSWLISEKNLAQTDDQQEQALITIQKDAKDDPLIGELRLYAKKLAKTCQEDIPDYEGRLSKTTKDLAQGQMTTDKLVIDLAKPEAAGLKKSLENSTKILPFQIEGLKAKQTIATAYEIKLAKLLS